MSSSEGVVHEGWLTKTPRKGASLFSSARRRFIVLRSSGAVQWYNTDSKVDLRGTCTLTAQSTVARSAAKPLTIDVTFPDRFMQLKAESEQELQVWLGHLQSAVQRLAGGSG
jgi:hypothetical protein